MGLSYGALGAIGGAGVGMAQTGNTLQTEALREEADVRMRARDQAHQDRIDDRLYMRAGLKDLGAGGGSGTHRGSGSASTSALEIAQDPGALSLLGGMDRGDANDYVAMAKGDTPTSNVTLTPDRFANNPDRQDDAAAAGDQNVTVPKYSPGSAAALRQRAQTALFQAMKLSDPAHSDALSKSQSEDQKRAYADRYVGGDVEAGRGALMLAGHGTFNAAGDTLTGDVPDDSVAAATVEQRKAAAQQSRAAAGDHAAGADEKRAKTEAIKDEAGGKVSVKQSLSVLDSQRKKLTNDMTDLRAEEKALQGQFGDDADAARRGLIARRNVLQQRGDELDAQISDLTKRATAADHGGGEVSPPASLLKEGVITRFKNGQSWTLRNGRPAKV